MVRKRGTVKTETGTRSSKTSSKSTKGSLPTKIRQKMTGKRGSEASSSEKTSFLVSEKIPKKMDLSKKVIEDFGKMTTLPVKKTPFQMKRAREDTAFILVTFVLVSFLILTMSFYFVLKFVKVSPEAAAAAFYAIRPYLPNPASFLDIYKQEQLLENPFGLPIPTDICQRKFGRCFYYPSKFVDSCSNMRCSSLALRIKLGSDDYDGGKIRYLKYSSTSDVFITEVPEMTPCLKPGNAQGDHGLCRGKICFLDKEDRKILGNYVVNGKPVDGRWRNRSDLCIEIETDVFKYFVNLFSSLKCGYKNGDWCNPYLVSLRSCNNPAPSLGGEVCWQTSINGPSTMQPHYFPLKIIKECSNCPVPKSLVTDDQCNQTLEKACTVWTPSNDSEPFNLSKAMDFEPCCYRIEQNNNSKLYPGRCLGGICLFVDLSTQNDDRRNQE